MVTKILNGYVGIDKNIFQELRNLKSGKDTFRFVYIMWIEPSYYAIYITTFIL